MCYMAQVLLGLGKDGPLAPGTQYFYVVGDSADARSEALSFIAPPLTGPESLPYRRASELQLMHGFNLCI